jgi:hypothetical protein
MKRLATFVSLLLAIAFYSFDASAAVTAYKVVCGNSQVNLTTNMATAITGGYQPLGGAFVNGAQMCQGTVLGTPASVAAYETTEVYNPTVINGGTVTVTADAYLYNVALHEAGTIAGATVNITAGTRNGQMIRITSDHIITTLTLGATVAGDFLTAPTAAAVGDSFIFVWSVAKTKWEYMGDAI